MTPSCFSLLYKIVTKNVLIRLVIFDTIEPFQNVYNQCLKKSFYTAVVYKVALACDKIVKKSWKKYVRFLNLRWF